MAIRDAVNPPSWLRTHLSSLAETASREGSVVEGLVVATASSRTSMMRLNCESSESCGTNISLGVFLSRKTNLCEIYIKLVLPLPRSVPTSLARQLVIYISEL